MTRRICSMALALLLLAWTIPQAAAGSGPFAPVRTYEDQFTDVSPQTGSMKMSRPSTSWG